MIYRNKEAEYRAFHLVSRSDRIFRTPDGKAFRFIAIDAQDRHRLIAEVPHGNAGLHIGEIWSALDFYDFDALPLETYHWWRRGVDMHSSFRWRVHPNDWAQVDWRELLSLKRLSPDILLHYREKWRLADGRANLAASQWQ